jgi:hypothetical protein
MFARSCGYFVCDSTLQVTRAGFQARTALLNAIYEKSLRLRPTDKQASTTGQTVNLMANDTNRIFDCFLLMNFLWYVNLNLCIDRGPYCSSFHQPTLFRWTLYPDARTGRRR